MTTTADPVKPARPGGPRERVEGVLALQFPISKINNMTTVGKQWQDAGMGTTGEAFLLAPRRDVIEDLVTRKPLLLQDVGRAIDERRESLRQALAAAEE